MSWFNDYGKFVKEICDDTSPQAVFGFYLGVFLGLMMGAFVIYIEFFM